MPRVHLLVFPLVCLLACPVVAQESASYKLGEHTFNAGGNPADGTVLTSADFRMTLDALGDSVVGMGLSSASYHMDSSFVSAYPPPVEVRNLHFADDVTLVWNPERSVGVYNLYRDLLSALWGLGYGQCEQYDIDDETTTDPDLPATDQGYFYLVTAENRVYEEGTKGWGDPGGERANPSPCP